VNPAILSASGMPLAAVTAATCLSAAFGSILMGIVARYPIALAPGMGLNAYFTYTVCLKMHIPWQTALGAVFLSGVIFLALTAAGIRQMILRSIPHELYAAVASGIGLFIAFIGFRNSGLVIGDPETLVGLGNLRNPTTALALFGLILMVALEVKKVRGSILIGVLTITAVAWAIAFAVLHAGSAVAFSPITLAWAQSLVHWTPAPGGFRALGATMFQLDIRGAINKGLLEIVFVFFFVDLFDNLGTLVAVTKRAGLIAADHSIPRLDRILLADATATVFGSLTGTSTVTVTGLLFLGAIIAAPFVGIVPSAATAPALILVGSLMLATITEIRWTDPLVAVPSFLTLILIPLTYSIANGLGFGIIAWAVLHIATGRFRKQDWLLYTLAVLFLARFIYLGT
jgi:AGZA family xanthine/uracil permease-like MFS transporter